MAFAEVLKEDSAGLFKGLWYFLLKCFHDIEDRYIFAARFEEGFKSAVKIFDFND